MKQFDNSRSAAFATLLLCCGLTAIPGCSGDSTPPPDVPVVEASRVEPAADSAATNSLPDPTRTAPAEGSGHAAQSDSIHFPETPAVKPDPRFHALLVGCTRYDHLEPEVQLKGPANDVDLMKQLLKHRFGFLDEQVTTLSERSGAANRPIKDNIVRELSRLAEETSSGDSVVVLLSGHGCQQPNLDPDADSDLEPDGLDEVFLPADISRSEDPDAWQIPNGISDDELGRMLRRIRDRGAFVWVIVDACHSGSAVRGTQTVRGIPPETLLSTRKLRSGSAVPAATRGIQGDDGVLAHSEGLDGLVAIYAAQPHEPTLELPLPTDDDDAQWRGLLTYTMAKVLAEMDGTLTYSGLMQRIRANYVQELGLQGPTPLIEGKDRERVILGETTGTNVTSFALESISGDHLVMTGGQLHGLTTGSILAAGPAPGQGDPSVTLGYVRITRVRLADSDVVPIAYEDQPANWDLPLSGHCRPVRVDYGDLALRVAVDGVADAVQEPQITAIKTLLKDMQSQSGCRFQVIDDPARADWLVRRREDGLLVILPAAGWSGSDSVDQPLFGPVPTGAAAKGWMWDSLGRIARVHGLLKVCALSSAQKRRGWLESFAAGRTCAFDMELLRAEPDTEQENSVDWAQGDAVMHDGDRLVLRVTNAGIEAIDFSVLFVDSHYGISPLFPAPGLVADNRLEFEASLDVGPMEVDATSTGLEHLIVIATRGAGQPIDWSWLGQPSLPQARSASAAGQQLLASAQTPIGEIFQRALFGAGSERGMRMVDAEGVEVKVITWTTTREPR